MAFFGNLMNNYFYGKSGKGDYRIEDMPQNRFQLFGAVLKTRWSALVGVNLLYVLFWLPAAAWTLLNYITLVSGAAENVTGLFSTYLLILIPLIALTGPFTAGATYVLRNWARDEHSFVWSDFWDAVKANWKQALVVSAISGLMPYMLFMGYTFYGTMASTKSFVFMIPLAAAVSGVHRMEAQRNDHLYADGDLRSQDKGSDSQRDSAYGRQSPAGGRRKAAHAGIPDHRVRSAVLHSVDRAAGDYGILPSVPDLHSGVQPPDHLLVFQRAVRKISNSKIGAPTNIGLRPENWDDTEYRPEDDE